MDFSKDNGLISNDIDTNDDYLKLTFEEVKKKLNIDAIFFHGTGSYGPRRPLIYFKLMDSRNSEQIAELHKLSWNFGQAPLLFVVLPDTVLVYNNLEPPTSTGPAAGLDDRAGLITDLNIFSELEEDRARIREYERRQIETGDYWRRHAPQFNAEKGVFRMLLNNLDFMRSKLLQDRLRPEFVHAILIRSIFTKYLEDRRDTQGHNVFPEGFFSQFLSGAERFVDLLSNKRATYSFFRYLMQKFNGDIFTIEDGEEDAVHPEHLNLLQRMLLGEEHMKEGQGALWKLYSFDVIPIELISSIYEQFFREENKTKVATTGIHYTPYHLVEYLMDEVLPVSNLNFDTRVLDPACGSGIFLVEGYRRLIARWKKARGRFPKAPELIALLKENIYGVDKDEKAVRITALSLYLTLCEYLEPKTIWDGVRFERLMNRNLFATDFFESAPQFNTKKFDLVVGNPPWERRLTTPAERYSRRAHKPIGGGQICQLFLWRAADLCQPGGTVCMITSSKALLFNRSTTNKAFRKSFFSRNYVKMILNLSALRHLLFTNAVGPGAAIIYSPQPPPEKESIPYYSPKPTYTLQDELFFMIGPQDIQIIPLEEALRSEIIWKVAMWGSPRDYDLIQKLSKLPTLGDISAKRRWVHGEGYIVGNESEITKKLLGRPEVTTAGIQRFVIEKERLKKCERDRFERVRRLELYQGPHLLIRQSPKSGEGFIAALMTDEAVFSQSIVGIHSDPRYLNDLRAMCHIINSDIATYYSMLTSSRWLVERDELEKEEIMSLPVPEAVLGRKLSEDFLENLAKDDEFRRSKDDELMHLFGISSVEREFIRDTIGYTLDFFRRKGQSEAVEPPSERAAKQYTTTLCKVLNRQFGSSRRFSGTIYESNGPLRLVSIQLESGGSEMVRTEQNWEEMDRVLRNLDRQLIQEMAGSVYVRRDLRRYSKKTIHIIKPNQMRYWTESSAHLDADHAYSDIMKSWKTISK